MLKVFAINKDLNQNIKEKIAGITAILLAFIYNLISFLLLLSSGEK